MTRPTLSRAFVVAPGLTVHCRPPLNATQEEERIVSSAEPREVDASGSEQATNLDSKFYDLANDRLALEIFGDLIPWLALAVDAIGSVNLVDALYMVPAEESDWGLLVVAEEHEDALYDALVGIEAKIDHVSAAPVDLRVTAHQGRPVLAVVPSSAIELFRR